MKVTEDKDYCTFAYESVVGRGHITILSEDEKLSALQSLMNHYHTEDKAEFNPTAIPRTAVYKPYICQSGRSSYQVRKRTYGS